MDKEKINKKLFLKGIKDGIPIALGYFAVAFTLGITAKKAGMNAAEATLMSALMLASAGEFAAISMISAGAGVLEMIFTTLVINMRYLIMSSAISQRIDESKPFWHRIFVSYAITDEIFGIAMLRSTVDGKLQPIYQYGATFVAAPSWALGTFLGAALGTVMPSSVMSALGIAIYGMFIAIVTPGAKKNKVVGATVLVSMALSFLFEKLPYIKEISSGFRIIILTVLISAVAAILFPLNDKGEISVKNRRHVKEDCNEK